MLLFGKKITDKKEALEIVKEDGLILKKVAIELQNDKEIVLEAVKNNGVALTFASEVLQDDVDVVSEAVKSDSFAINYASDRLKNDKMIVLLIVNQNGLMLANFNDELRNDKEIVLSAVKNNGMALKYASDDLCNDKEVVLEAIKNNENALSFASEVLQQEINNKNSIKKDENISVEIINNTSNELYNYIFNNKYNFGLFIKQNYIHSILELLDTNEKILHIVQAMSAYDIKYMRKIICNEPIIIFTNKKLIYYGSFSINGTIPYENLKFYLSERKSLGMIYKLIIFRNVENDILFEFSMNKKNEIYFDDFYSKLLSISKTNGFNEITQEEYLKIMNREYKKICNTCGKIFCYTDSDISENMQNAKISMVASTASIANSFAGSMYNSFESSKMADRASDKIVDYSKCPYCNSNDISNYDEKSTKNVVLSPADELKKYKELLDIGAITNEEYEQKKKELLNL